MKTAGLLTLAGLLLPSGHAGHTDSVYSHARPLDLDQFQKVHSLDLDHVEFQTVFTGSTMVAVVANSKIAARLRHLGRHSAVGHTLVKSLRGGSTTASDNTGKALHTAMPVKEETCAVLISTTVGSPFLDKRKRISVSKSATVWDVKAQLSQKFPGSPPQELQRLFFGIRLLSDDQVVGNLSALNPIPIMLDMITGTSAYNKTMSISQSLEAYASIAVQQSYVGDRLKNLFAVGQQLQQQQYSPSSSAAASAAIADSVIIDTAIYKDMFIAVNESIHATYMHDIHEALVEEQEPETFSADTASWRHNKKDKSPITVALAKEFDLNMRGIRNFAYYSVLLGVRPRLKI